LSGWWRQFNDATLNALVERALGRNYELREAQSRIREARAILAVAGGAALPSLDVDAAFQRLRFSENGLLPVPAHNPTSFYLAGFDASWEIDLFGGIRREVEAAQAELEASVEGRRQVQLALVAEVARQYVELRSLQGRLENAQKNIRAMTESAELARARYQAGLTSELDSLRASELLHVTQAQIPQFATGVKIAQLRLGVLLGETGLDALPEALGEAAELPRLQARLPAILPSDLLSRRPDLRRAERELAAANARVGVATADLYPRFSLIGSFGSIALGANQFGDSGSRFWSFGPTLRWPLFQGGRIRARIEAQDARFEQASIRYEKALAVAIEEVEASTGAYVRQSSRADFLRKAENADVDAVGLATQRYRTGLSDYLAVLDAQRQLYATSDQRLQSERESLVSLIALYKAVGGGWSAEEAAAQN